MSSTELATVDLAELNKLAAAAGANPNANSGPRVPFLKVNMEDEDANGAVLPRGQFMVTDQEETVYAKEVKFRPLTMHLQYIHYDQDAKKMVSRTLQNSTFQQEFRDSNGTIRCGRPSGDEWRNMEKEDREPYKDITCVRLVRGIVSYTGVNQAGEERVVENVPCVLRLKGTNFSPFEAEYMDKVPQGRMIWDYWLDLSLERKKNGSVTYYIIHYSADFALPVPVDVPTFETIKHFTKLVEDDNARVESDYKSALARRNGDAALYDQLADDDALDGDLEDAA